MPPSLIKFNRVSLGYAKQVILPPLNLEIKKGDFLGIVGPNGSGKTTILRAILGLIKPLEGEIVHSESNPKFGYVMQRQFLDDIFSLTVQEIVMMGRYGKIGLFRKPKSKDRQLVEQALETVGIQELAKRPYRELSGGQKQRVLVARALASEPEVLILDEPTNDLDIKGEEQTMELIRGIHDQPQVTVIMVSHFLNVVLNYVKSIIFLNQHEVKVHLVEDIIKNNTLSEVFDIKVYVGETHGKKYIILGEENAGAL